MRRLLQITTVFKMEGVAIIFKGYKPLIIAEKLSSMLARVLATPLLSEVNANKWRKDSSDSYLQ